MVIDLVFVSGDSIPVLVGLPLCLGIAEGGYQPGRRFLVRVVSNMDKMYQDLQKELEITRTILEKKKTEYNNVSSELDKSSSEFDSIESSDKKLEKKN